jgi:hypothetical protein
VSHSAASPARGAPRHRVAHDPSAAARRAAAARAALALCARADALAHDLEAAVETDDELLFDLLSQRDRMLEDLAEQLLVLRTARPTADSGWLASTERLIDDADALVDQVLAAVSSSHHVTLELTARLARRSDEIRAELEIVQRASTASTAYGVQAEARHVDRRR